MRTKKGISGIVATVFFILIVLLVFSVIALTFDTFTSFTLLSQNQNAQQQSVKGSNLSVTGLTFGGITPPAGGAVDGAANIGGHPLTPISNMNFTNNDDGWFVTESYSLLSHSASISNSPYEIDSTTPVPLPGEVDFSLQVNETDASSPDGIGYVALIADQDLGVQSVQPDPPTGWNAPSVAGNTIIWTSEPLVSITPGTTQTFEWTATVQNSLAVYNDTVQLRWVSSAAGTPPYVDSGIATVNTTVTASDSGDVSAALITPAPASTVPGGAQAGFDSDATTTASSSGPGSIYASFDPTFNGAPVPSGQQLTATMNFTTSFTLDSATASDIASSPCCTLSWEYSLDQLVSPRNPDIQVVVYLIEEEPYTPVALGDVDPTIVNDFNSTGWQKVDVNPLAVPSNFFAAGRYDLVMSVTADMPGVGIGGTGFPPQMLMHLDDIGLSIRMNPSTYYADVSGPSTSSFTLDTGLNPAQVEGVYLRALVSGTSPANVNAYVYVEDASASEQGPVWLQVGSLTFQAPAEIDGNVTGPSTPFYVDASGNIDLRVYAISTQDFSLQVALDVVLKTSLTDTVVVTFQNTSSEPVNLVSLYLSGPTGLSHYDATLANPNYFDIWVNAGQVLTVQEAYTWTPGVTYTVTAVSANGQAFGGTFSS